MTELVRTSFENADFTALVQLLDADLAVRDGDDHAFYAQFNKTAGLQHVITAYINGQAVACGALRPFAADAMEVKRMYVLPGFRGRGIARAVLQGLEVWAAELGYKRCVLETGNKQPEAISLYSRSGYQRIDNYGQYAGIENSVCFEKWLPVQ